MFFWKFYTCLENFKFFRSEICPTLGLIYVHNWNTPNVPLPLIKIDSFIIEKLEEFKLSNFAKIHRIW